MSEQAGRWTKATVYPDMWVSPDEDPRNSEGVSLDGDLETLKDYLDNYRLTLRLKCEDLDAEQLARRSVPPSTMSLLGLVRHLAEAERDWRNWITIDDPHLLFSRATAAWMEPTNLQEQAWRTAKPTSVSTVAP